MPTTIYQPEAEETMADHNLTCLVLFGGPGAGGANPGKIWFFLRPTYDEQGPPRGKQLSEAERWYQCNPAQSREMLIVGLAAIQSGLRVRVLVSDPYVKADADAPYIWNLYLLERGLEQ
jgi:hypothetical protein